MLFCGGEECHPRRTCSARNAVCSKCQKKGHFAKCCRSKSSSSVAITSLPSPTSQLCAITPAPACLSYATITAFLHENKVSMIIDSDSSLSYINDRTADTLGLRVQPCEEVISLASSESKGQVVGKCEVNLTIENEKYLNVNLKVLKGLCADVLLGGDFQRQHKRVIFQFDGEKSDLVVGGQEQVNAVAAADVKPVSLQEFGFRLSTYSNQV